MNGPRFRLRSLGEAAGAPSLDLTPGTVKTIGRSLQADVVVDDPELSRFHARVRMADPGTPMIEDLDSTNGVFVNGVRTRQAALEQGDRIRLGSIEFVLDEAGPAEPPAVPETTIVRMPVGDAAPTSVDRDALEALLLTSRELMAFSDLQRLLDRVLDRLQAILKPDRAAILLVDQVTGALTPRAVRPPGAYGSVSEFASATAVREALAGRDALVAYDARLDARLHDAPSVAVAGVRAAMCVPLLGRNGPIGALYADQLSGRGPFTPQQVQYASAFAATAAVALETAQLHDELQQHFRATLEVFAKAIDARDHYTAGHSERVTAYTLALAETVGLPAGELHVIRRAGMLHDIGKVGVPDHVLLKPGPLDAAERAIMKSHVVIGYEMLSGLPFLRDALPSIRGHHERWDGTGYPDRVAGRDIHPHARLMAVADSYDAMTSARPYRDALSLGEAAQRLRNERGRQFDPEAIDAFDSIEREFVAIRTRLLASAGQLVVS
jgi:putative nucleotidyltransferase with HDIG domain